MPKADKDGIGQKVAERAGVYRNYFYRLRKTNMECFEYMKAFCPSDMAKAYQMYQEHRLDITNKACEIYYDLEDAGLLYEFGNVLVENGVYQNPKSYAYTSNTIFRPEGIKTFKALMLVKKSNELYDSFRSKCA